MNLPTYNEIKIYLFMVVILLFALICWQLGQINQTQLEALIKEACPYQAEYTISPLGNSLTIIMPLTWGNYSSRGGGYYIKIIKKDFKRIL